MDAWKRMQARQRSARAAVQIRAETGGMRQRQRSAREAVRLRAEARGVRPLTAKEAGRRVIISVEWWIIGILGLFLGAGLYQLLAWVGLSGRYTALACLAIGWMLPVIVNFSLLRRRRR